MTSRPHVMDRQFSAAEPAPATIRTHSRWGYGDHQAAPPTRRPDAGPATTAPDAQPTKGREASVEALAPAAIGLRLDPAASGVLAWHLMG